VNVNSTEDPELPSLDQLVAEIRARGPRDALRHRGTQQFDTAFAQAGVDHDPAEFNRLWQTVESEMKDRDRADQQAEGRT
jgi:hypothetical protein